MRHQHRVVHIAQAEDGDLGPYHRLLDPLVEMICREFGTVSRLSVFEWDPGRRLVRELARAGGGGRCAREWAPPTGTIAVAIAGASTRESRSAICIPIRAGREVLGCLEVERRRGRILKAVEAARLEKFSELFAGPIQLAGSLEQTIRSRDHLERLIDDTGEGRLALDAQERIVGWSPGMEHLTGYRGEEILGRRLQELAGPRNLGQAALAATRVMGGGTRERIEDRIRCKDGRSIDVGLTVSPFNGPAGAPVGVSAIVRDVTDLRRMEEEREMLRLHFLKTENLSAAGQLISGVAHELNNPLTGVIGYAQLLTGQPCDEKIKRGLETVYSEARRCQSIVQNLLTFARKHTPERRSISVNDIIESIVELRSYQLRTDNIAMETVLLKDLPRTMGDFHQLQQAFLHLINNAHQSIKGDGGGGSIRIQTSVERDWIRVQFTDTGPGIAQENLGRIFDPFFSNKPNGQGTGLGLAICHDIILEHDGRLHADSHVGAGATFTIDLPMLRQEAASAQPGAGEGGGRPPSLSGNGLSSAS